MFNLWTIWVILTERLKHNTSHISIRPERSLTFGDLYDSGKSYQTFMYLDLEI